jgi:hypothetical protein
VKEVARKGQVSIVKRCCDICLEEITKQRRNFSVDSRVADLDEVAGCRLLCAKDLIGGQGEYFDVIAIKFVH